MQQTPCYMVIYEPPSIEQELADQKAIRAYYDDVSVHRIFPGLWFVISAPNAGCVAETFFQALGYRPRYLVSSIPAGTILRLTNEDVYLRHTLRDVFPSDVIVV